MKIQPFLAAVSLALAVVATPPVFAAAETPPAGGDKASADQLLRAMSAKLATAQSFSFEATREIDPALLAGRDVSEKARVAAAVQRPNKLTAKVTSQTGVRRFVFDGRTLTLLDETANHYASVPLRTSLDGLVAAVDEKYGFTPPLAEFALSDPYAEFRRQAETITYLGRGKTTGGFLGLGGIECHRIGLKGRAADAELWLAVGDLLPRQLTATFHRAGQPQVRITFASWNLAAPAADFTFTAPKGAEKIEMWTPAQMTAASRKTAARKN